MATRASVKNEKQYEALKDKGMSKERAAKIANSPKASSHGGKNPGRAATPAGRHDGAEEGSRPEGRQGRGQEVLRGCPDPTCRSTGGGGTSNSPPEPPSLVAGTPHRSPCTASAREEYR